MTTRLKPAERRRQILDVAQSLLATKGFAALTLRNAATASGIRLSTLQYHFATREILFEAAFQDIADKAWNDILQLISDDIENDPKKRLGQFIKSLCLSTQSDTLTGLFVELWAAARTHGFASNIMDQYYEDAVALLAELIRDTLRDITPRESRRRAILMLSTVEGLSLFRQMDQRQSRKSVVSRKSAEHALMKLATG
ncbi:MAG: TetR/AcrR family transcriptional regulator [Pseudomonadota bacterium]